VHTDPIKSPINPGEVLMQEYMEPLKAALSWAPTRPRMPTSSGDAPRVPAHRPAETVLCVSYTHTGIGYFNRCRVQIIRQSTACAAQPERDDRSR
jgi:hypothetical protein